MTISEYKLKQDFRAPKINLKEGEMQSYHSYVKNSKVTGYIDKSTGTGLLIVENSFALPTNVIEFVKDVEIDGKPVTEIKTEKPTATEQAKKDVKKNIDMPAEYKAQMEKIKNTNVVQSIVNKSRNSVNGIVFGGIAGLVIAIFAGKSKMMGIVLGATAGGLIGYGISGEAKKDPKKPEQKKNDGKKD